MKRDGIAFAYVTQDAAGLTAAYHEVFGNNLDEIDRHALQEFRIMRLPKAKSKAGKGGYCHEIQPLEEASPALRKPGSTAYLISVRLPPAASHCLVVNSLNPWPLHSF